MKVLGTIAIGLVVLFLVVIFTGIAGEHGPGRHFGNVTSGQTHAR